VPKKNKKTEDNISGGRRHFWRKTTFPAEDDISGEDDFLVADSGPPT
jgi:hypothetical protein